MMTAGITYTVTPCPSCGIDMPGIGTVTENGNRQFNGLIWCNHCEYAVAGRGDTDFFAAGDTVNKHQAAVKRSGWRRIYGKA